MKLRLAVLLIAVLAAGSLPAAAQDNVSRADAAYQGKNWSEAARLYDELTKANPQNGRYWYRLGVAEQAQQQHERALAAFTQAKSHGAPLAMVAYNLACVYATMDRRDEAFAGLKEALQAGFAQPEQMNSDADLATVRSDERFPSLLEQAKHNQQPCEYNSENRQFDFWIGDWDVSPSNNAGTVVGASHIEKTIGGCVIWENWTSLGNGYFGKSYNIYNASLARWEQFWVDNQGGMMHFYGGLKDGVMDFYTDDMPQPDGKKLRRHLQFFNLGGDKVRQFSQGSTDGGKTWTVEYDFTYVRKKST
jgi:tetratricopeptide (TPR) repeat protein